MSLRFVLLVALLFALPLGAPILTGAEPAPIRPKRVVVNTDLGELSISLDWSNAPDNSATFVRYIREGIYAGTSFDDLDEFCLYGGKPALHFPGIASNGNMICTAGPPGEFKLPNRRGAVGYRRTAGSCNPDKRSNCTQIYVMLKDHPQGDGEFSVFGTLEAEPAVVDAIKSKVLEHAPVSYKVELRDE